MYDMSISWVGDLRQAQEQRNATVKEIFERLDVPWRDGKGDRI